MPLDVKQYPKGLGFGGIKHGFCVTSRSFSHLITYTRGEICLDFNSVVLKGIKVPLELILWLLTHAVAICCI